MKKNILKSKLKQIFLKYKLSNKHAELCSNYLIKAEILEAKGHDSNNNQVLDENSASPNENKHISAEHIMEEE